MIERKAKSTLISLSNFSATFFLCTFCAAVTSPLSGVHSSGVSTTACKISIGLNPFFFPASLHAFRTVLCTSSSAHSVLNDISDFEEGSTCRR